MTRFYFSVSYVLCIKKNDDKKTAPTDPNFFEHVTPNTHTHTYIYILYILYIIYYIYYIIYICILYIYYIYIYIYIYIMGPGVQFKVGGQEKS